MTPGPYLHIGADEAFGMPAELFSDFVALARDEVLALGKQPIAWQEASRGISDGYVAQYWNTAVPGDLERGIERMPQDSPLRPLMGMLEASGLIDMLKEEQHRAPADLPRIAAQDVPVIVSPATPLYLSYPHDGEREPCYSRAAAVGAPMMPPGSLRDVWEWTPDAVLAEHPGLPVQGIEAAIWSETVRSIDDLGWLLLPRLLAVAERAWSASTGGAWDDFAARAFAQERVWANAGWVFHRSPLLGNNPSDCLRS
jgi:hexosaminidase